MRQIVLDTETTGLSVDQGHRVIEIGCVELINRRYTGNYLHEYFNPEREVEAGALQVHGLSNEFLSSKPLFKSFAEKLLQFISGAELIIHNAPFDIAFLNSEFKLVFEPFTNITEQCSVIDTLVLARQKHPGQQNSLDALCRRYQVDNSKRELHGALLDARLLAEIYLAMTGGQGSLFGDDKVSMKPVVTQKIATQNATQIQAPIIYATTAEQQAHAQYLRLLKKTSGDKVIWPILTEPVEQV